jgi:DNA polymerase-1
MDGGGLRVTRTVDAAPPFLVAVDGHNLLWRAEYGFPSRVTARDGTDRTAVFAFFALLRVALREVAQLAQPAEGAECVVCFDGEHGAGRRQRTDGAYKANREQIDLTPLLALPDVQRGLSTVGIPWVEIDDQEADDVIASLLIRAASDRRAFVFSTDRDYLQLVDDRVSVLNTAMRAGRRLIDPEHVRARYGVGPSQWCDFRALTGDPSDGIPGVSGVGPKTAAWLLAGGITLDALPASGRLTGRTGQAVRDNWDKVLGWRDLIRLDAGIDMPYRPTELPTAPLPAPAAVLEELKLW